MPHSRPAPGRYFIVALVAILAIVLADQYTKWLVMETMLRVEQPEMPGFFDWFMARETLEFFVIEREEFRTVTLAPWLNFVMVWNQGISFGLFDTNNPAMPIVFITLSLIISALMLIGLALSRRRLLSAALALIVGGALGNVIDRVRFGAVADFIDLHIGSLHWPAFNLADACIVAGAILMVADAAIHPGKTQTA